jgi:hypothetical protein
MLLSLAIQEKFGILSKGEPTTTKGAQWKTLWCLSFSMLTIADCSASAKGFPSFDNPVNRSVLQEMLYH